MAMRKSGLFISAFAFIAMAIGIAVFALIPRPGNIRYHLQRLGSLRKTTFGSSPSTLHDYFRKDTWLWYLRGKPSIEDLEQEQQALIQPGFFERRDLTFRHRTLDAQLWSQFHSAISNSSLAEWRYVLHLDGKRSRNRVYAGWCGMC